MSTSARSCRRSAFRSRAPSIEVGDVAVDICTPGTWPQHIPEARYVELPGSDHLPWIGDAEPIVAEIQELVTEHGPSPSQTASWPPCSELFVDAPYPAAAGREAMPAGGLPRRGRYAARSPGFAATCWPRAGTASVHPSTGPRARHPLRGGDRRGEQRRGVPGRPAHGRMLIPTTPSFAESPSTWSTRSSPASPGGGPGLAHGGGPRGRREDHVRDRGSHALDPVHDSWQLLATSQARPPAQPAPE